MLNFMADECDISHIQIRSCLRPRAGIHDTKLPASESFDSVRTDSEAQGALLKEGKTPALSSE